MVRTTGRGSRLRLVQILMAGYEAVLPAPRPGVALATAAEVHNASTSELAVCLIIAALRGLPRYVRQHDTGTWRPRSATSLADRHVLLVGLGGLGRAIAARLAPFDCTLTPVASRSRPGVIGIDDVLDLLPAHDVVILAVPLTAQTKGLVGPRFLAAMTDDALLVNVADGPIVDTSALLSEPASGRLNAAVDVIDPEPLPPGHPAWQEPRLLLTPHVGGASSAFRPVRRRCCANSSLTSPRARLPSTSSSRPTPRSRRHDSFLTTQPGFP